MNKIVFRILAFVFVLGPIHSLYAFDNKITHKDITEKAALSSQSDQILKGRLAFKSIKHKNIT